MSDTEPPRAIAREMELLASRVAPLEDVRVFTYHPQHWCRGASRSAVEVAWVTGTAGVGGRGITGGGYIQVPVDVAGDLSRTPEASVTPEEADVRNGLTWRITAVALSEQEAAAAFGTVRTAVECP